MQPGGRLIVNASSRHIYFVTRYGAVRGYLNTSTVTGGEVQNAGIACDHGDGSLWSTNDERGLSNAWNYTAGGNRLRTIRGSMIWPEADTKLTELEGVTVCPRTYNLYFVFDNPGQRLVYADRFGQPIWVVDLAPYGVLSAQDLDYNRLTGTLLCICNESKKIYELDSAKGALVRKLDLSGILPQPRWQSITVDLDTGYWWLSGYHPNTVIMIDPLQLSQTPTNPTTILSFASAFASWPVPPGDISGICYDPRW